jgi:hypothetical protein
LTGRNVLRIVCSGRDESPVLRRALSLRARLPQLLARSLPLRSAVLLDRMPARGNFSVMRSGEPLPTERSYTWRPRPIRRPAPVMTAERVSPADTAWRRSLEWGTGFCLLVTSLFVIADPENYWHWFIIPVCLCGCVVVFDGIEWIRGRRGLIDPIGLLGLLGVHFFFLAPLLHVWWDYWMLYVKPPSDWRPWLGWMAFLNLLGLLVYRGIVAVSATAPRPAGRIWALDHHRFVPLLVTGLFVSAVLQVWTYSAFGGIEGYVAAYASRESRAEFAGMGWLFMISEAFPFFALLLFAHYARRTRQGSDWATVGVVLVVFLVLKVFFGGLRGSRANYVWPLFWSVGIIHLWVRHLSKKWVALGLVFLIGFMYAYGLYKGYGVDVVRALEGAEQRQQMAKERGRGLDATLLGDMGRADVQAYTLYRLMSPDVRSRYEYAWGRTYVGAAALLVPSRVWPGRPPTKVREATELLYGERTFGTRHFVSTNAFGLAGETMLNFSPLAVPLAFGLLGLAVSLVTRWSKSLDRNDARQLIVPFAVTVLLYLLIWDSDVTLYYVITAGLLPVLIVTVSSVKRPARAAQV